MAGKLQQFSQCMDTNLLKTRAGMAATSHVNQPLAAGTARGGNNTLM